MKIVALSGSLREISYTRMGLTIILNEISKFGIDVELLDLRTYNLPFCMENEQQPLPESAQNLLKKVQEADGIIWGTPEYHGSYSGVLKNAIDLMGSAEFRDKVIGLYGVGGGAIGAVNALSHLRAVGRNLHAWVIPQEVSVANATEKFTDDGKCIDKAIVKRMKEFATLMVKTTMRFSSMEINELVNNKVT